MKIDKTYLVARGLMAALMLSVIEGCIIPDQETIYRERRGKNWAEKDVEQYYRDPRGRESFEREKVYERRVCVDKNGKKIRASTKKECLDKGGTVVDTVCIEEESIKGR